MYREHLTNSNTAAIYDDIYENIGGGAGYNHLCLPQLNFQGEPYPPAPPPKSPPLALVSIYDEMFKVPPNSGGAYRGGCPPIAFSRSCLLFAAAARFHCRSLRAISWWSPAYSLATMLSDVCLSACLLHTSTWCGNWYGVVLFLPAVTAPSQGAEAAEHQCFPKFGGSLLSMRKCLKNNRMCVVRHTGWVWLWF